MRDLSTDLPLLVLEGGTRTQVALRGELDLATVPALRHHLAIAIDVGTDDLLIEMSAVTFCDSTTLSLLVTARHLLAGTGRRMRVVEPSGAVRRLLRLADLEALLI